MAENDNWIELLGLIWQRKGLLRFMGNAVKSCTKFTIPFLLMSFTLNVNSYEFTGRKWIGGKATIYASIPGISDSGIAWNTALLNATLEWNQKTAFNFTLLPIYRDPCVADGLNSIKFTSDLCGQRFNDATLAVTVLKYKEQELGPDAISEADIFVRDDISFDIFDGDLMQAGATEPRVDFKRTILHELGHVIGLDHEESKVAIMQPEISDIFSLQPDDIIGANKLYTGTSNCEVKELNFGQTLESLNLPDCTVKNLTLGGSDDSFIDLYRFKISAPSIMDFAINSTELESVLIIADTDLNYIAVDSDTSDGCNASLKAELDAGDYYLMVNTFDKQIKQQCELVGQYELTANYVSESPIGLNLQVNSDNIGLNSKFFGSITANGGETYGNKFSPQDSLDISASIDIDPSHGGKEGFIVVAAVIQDSIMLLNKKGQFVEFSAVDTPIIPVLEKKLEEIETIEITRDLVAIDFGIESIAVDFFVGYGLTEEGNQIYTHAKPFNLTIAPSIEEY